MHTRAMQLKATSKCQQLGAAPAVVLPLCVPAGSPALHRPAATWCRWRDGHPGWSFLPLTTANIPPYNEAGQAVHPTSSFTFTIKAGPGGRRAHAAAAAAPCPAPAVARLCALLCPCTWGEGSRSGHRA